ncbi:PEGA domain-containing protein [Pendulispora brunnea]|uniref:PEGA domain-containing protein n=1 Tax=Pendulispora brunnea TaxID=2905690 RepID=A0ABZ2KIQ3_9BACT
MTRMIRSAAAVSLASALLVSGAAFAQVPGVSGPVPPANPANADEAQMRFKRGLELYDEQDFQNALIEFRRAYELQPTYKILYNLGQVCFQLTEYACALRNFEKYLKEGGPNVASDRRAEVERDIAKLQTRIGRIEIVTNVPGVDITIDDTYIGKTPLDASVPVGAGRRKITATKEGRAPLTRIVEVAGTESTRVQLDMVSNVTTVTAPETPSKWTTWSTVGVIAAGGLAAVGATTGILALKASSDLKDSRFAGNTPDSSTENQQSKVKTLSVVTDVFIGAAIATLGTTLILTLTRDPKPEEAEEKPEEKKAARALPKRPSLQMNVGVGPGSVMLGGRF